MGVLAPILPMKAKEEKEKEEIAKSKENEMRKEEWKKEISNIEEIKNESKKLQLNIGENINKMKDQIK